MKIKFHGDHSPRRLAMQLSNELEDLREVLAPVTHWKVDEIREMFKAFHNETDPVEHARWREMDRQLVMYGCYVNNLELTVTAAQSQVKKILKVSKKRKSRNRVLNGLLQKLRVEVARVSRERDAIARTLVMEVRGELEELRKKIRGADA